MCGDAETIICRCEDVTLETVVDCIENGYTTINDIKRATRAGMGPCQGRTCRNLIASELSRRCGVSMEDMLMSTYRPPVIPITLGVLADAYEEK